MMSRSIKIVTIGTLMLLTVNAASANHSHYWRKFRNSMKDGVSQAKKTAERVAAAAASAKAAKEIVNNMSKEYNSMKEFFNKYGSTAEEKFNEIGKTFEDMMNKTQDFFEDLMERVGISSEALEEAGAIAESIIELGPIASEHHTAPEAQVLNPEKASKYLDPNAVSVNPEKASAAGQTLTLPFADKATQIPS